jgi:hypothetical protein
MARDVLPSHDDVRAVLIQLRAGTEGTGQHHRWQLEDVATVTRIAAAPARG